ncbi:MAG: HD domain-containing phosphohydrolase [Thermoleophilia bacterium]
MSRAKRITEDGSQPGWAGVAEARGSGPGDDLGRGPRAASSLRLGETALLGDGGERRGLFANMLEGFAYCRMIFDEAGRPGDWEYLAVNPAFERLTGLRDVVGKTVSQVLPQVHADHPDLIARYGRVAATGEADDFEIEFKPLATWLHVSAFSPAAGHFAAVFVDIGERKRVEMEATLFSSAIENASVSLLIVDAAANIVRANRHACGTLGRTEDEVLSLTLADIDPDFRFERWPAYVEGLRHSGVHRICRTVRRGSDAAEVPLELHLSLVEVGGQELVVAFGQDVSERLATESALGERERELGTLFGNLQGMVYRCGDDAHGIMEFVSAGCAELTGHAPEALQRGGPVSYGADVIAATHRESVRRAVREGIARGESWTVDYPIVTAAGETRWVWERGVAVRDEDGRVQALEGLVTDATAQHKAEAKLSLAAEEWRQTFDAMHDSVALLDVEGTVLRCNAAAAALTGRGFDELVGQRCFGVFHGGTSFHCDCPHRRAMLSGCVETSTFEQDGAWLRITCRPVLDTDGAVQGAVHAVTDITELKRTEHRLTEAVASQRAITDGVIAALARTVEVRDPYTAGHEYRASELAAAIAGELGLDADRVQGVRVAGMLHDVGKITIPPEILSKPGRLSPMEFALIKLHAQAGHDILEAIEFPWRVAEMTLQHHERLDGSGYPRGLSGEQLLLEARILAVADVVEAMSSHRPYRAALGLEAALEEVTRGAGSVYDGRVVEACVGLFSSGRFAFGDQSPLR